MRSHICVFVARVFTKENQASQSADLAKNTFSVVVLIVSNSGGPSGNDRSGLQKRSGRILCKSLCIVGS